MAVGYSQHFRSVVSHHELKILSSIPEQLSNTHLLSANTVVGIVSGLGVVSGLQEDVCGLCAPEGTTSFPFGKLSSPGLGSGNTYF